MFHGADGIYILRFYQNMLCISYFSYLPYKGYNENMN